MRKNANLLQTAAREAGERFYFEPKPCPKGHVGLRYAGDGKCKECISDRNRKKRDDPEFAAAANERHRKWRAENTDRALENSRQWYENNKERHIELGAAWRRANPDAVNTIRRRYYWNNLAEQRAYKRATVRKVRRARPLWADRDAIRRIYENCPEGMVVDHFAPINGKNICGLHVPENLQYLTVNDNSVKSNQWDWETQNAAWARDSLLPRKSPISWQIPKE